MDLGAFSVSLTVKDIAASQAFYEKFGFAQFMGEPVPVSKQRGIRALRRALLSKSASVSHY